MKHSTLHFVETQNKKEFELAAPAENFSKAVSGLISSGILDKVIDQTTFAVAAPTLSEVLDSDEPALGRKVTRARKPKRLCPICFSPDCNLA